MNFQFQHKEWAKTRKRFSRTSVQVVEPALGHISKTWEWSLKPRNAYKHGNFSGIWSIFELPTTVRPLNVVGNSDTNKKMQKRKSAQQSSWRLGLLPVSEILRCCLTETARLPRKLWKTIVASAIRPQQSGRKSPTWFIWCLEMALWNRKRSSTVIEGRNFRGNSKNVKKQVDSIN